MSKREIEELKQAAEPLLKLLNDSQKCHPHMKVIVTSTSVELVEGVYSTGTIMDYVKD